MLPASVISKSKSLISEGNIIVNENNNYKFPKYYLRLINNLLLDAYKKGVLIHHKYNEKYLLDNYRDMNTMYQMKYFL